MKKRFFIFTMLVLLLVFCSCSQRDLGLSSSAPSDLQSSAVSQPQSTSNTEVEKPSGESAPSVPSIAASAEMYAKILRSGTYYIDGTAVISFEGMTLENPMLIAVQEGNASVSISSDLSGATVTLRTLDYDGKTYSIDDAQRTYAEIEADQTANANRFNIDYSELTFTGEGTHDFCGEMLPFTEYQQGEDTVRLYFNSNTLVGLSRTISDEQLGELVLKIKGLSGNIPARLVEMPIGYTKE